MKNLEVTKDQQLLEKLIRGGRTNLSDWFENITDEICEEQAIEEIILVEVFIRSSTHTLSSNSCVPYQPCYLNS